MKNSIITDDYLRGLFDGEGSLSVSPCGNSYRVGLEIGNTCIPLLEQVHAHLRAKGYRASLLNHGRKTITGKPFARVLISNYRDIKRWFNEIGSLHPDKWNQWEKLRALKESPKTIAYPSARRYPEPRRESSCH